MISDAIADRYNEFFLSRFIMWQPFVVSLEIAYWCRVAYDPAERSERFEGWLDDYYGRYQIDAPEPAPFVGPLKPAPFTGQGYRCVSVPLGNVPKPAALAFKRLVVALGWHE